MNRQEAGFFRRGDPRRHGRIGFVHSSIETLTGRIDPPNAVTGDPCRPWLEPFRRGPRDRLRSGGIQIAATCGPARRTFPAGTHVLYASQAFRAHLI